MRQIKKASDFSSHLDVSVENSFGESFQRGALVSLEAGALVEQRDSRRVSGHGARVRVTEDFEVVVDGVADHHLPREQLQDLTGKENITENAQTVTLYL